MQLYAFTNGFLRLDMSVFLPSQPKGEKVAVPVPCYLIKHPDGNVLFDTGCHPDSITDAAGRWGGMARAFQVLAQPGDGLADQLDRFGLTPDDVHIIVNSHLHMDHCGSNGYFPKAKVYAQQAEVDCARDPASEGAGYYKADWDHGQDTVTLSGDHDIFGDGKLRIISTPGHTPGHQSLQIDLPKSGTFVLTGDACYTCQNLDRDLLPKVTWKPEIHKEAYARLRALRDEAGAFVVMGHDPWQWQDIRPAPEYFYE